MTNQEDIDEHIATGHEGHDEDQMEGMEGSMIEVEIEPGGTESLTVTFDGTDSMAQFACLIEGHYEAGTHGEFSFEE